MIIWIIIMKLIINYLEVIYKNFYLIYFFIIINYNNKNIITIIIIIL